MNLTLTPKAQKIIANQGNSVIVGWWNKFAIAEAELSQETSHPGDGAYQNHSRSANTKD
jgi:hypothetical protein